eukprot:Amastigsp_a847848_37.p2 type:complete len:393 gc:universal Amastigsp_a847848_37:1554-376(-)
MDVVDRGRDVGRVPHLRGGFSPGHCGRGALATAAVGRDLLLEGLALETQELKVRVGDNVPGDGREPLVALGGGLGLQNKLLVPRLCHGRLGELCGFHRFAARRRDLELRLGSSDGAHGDVLERHDALGHGFCRALGLLCKVIETPAREQKPAALPGLDAAALLAKEAFLVRRVKGGRLAVGLHGDLVVTDRAVESLEQNWVDVLAAVDSAGCCEELLEGHFVLDLGRVRVGVEHDEREGEHVDGVGVREDVGVVGVVALRKGFHHAIDLLRLARETEGREELAQRVVDVERAKVERAHERAEDIEKERLGLAEVLANHGLVEPRRVPQKRSMRGRRVVEEPVLLEVLDPVLGLRVEFLDPDAHVLGAELLRSGLAALPNAPRLVALEHGLEL